MIDSQPPINWEHVHNAIKFYRILGYDYKEVPWLVTVKAIELTLPKGHSPVTCRYGDLVGSAEQSFIQLAVIEGQDLSGKSMAATPCFRDDTLDLYHQRTFFKVELIEIRKGEDNWTAPALGRMVKEALKFFSSIGGGAAYPVSTNEGFDIALNGVEIGSYGIRKSGPWTWVYGTGYAAPRFSIAYRSLIK